MLYSFSLLVQRKRTKRKDSFSEEFLLRKTVLKTPRRLAPESRSFSATILLKRVFSSQHRIYITDTDYSRHTCHSEMSNWACLYWAVTLSLSKRKREISFVILKCHAKPVEAQARNLTCHSEMSRWACRSASEKSHLSFPAWLPWSLSLSKCRQAWHGIHY
jgi:hypothetical protein